MEFGAIALLDDRSIPVADVARTVEAAGLESLFLTEHTHVPVRRETEWPPGRSPRDEARLLDPLIALAVAAVSTERIRIGTGICLVSERDPIITAKETATIDFLSGGRFIFGVGAGWVTEELRNHGTDPSWRWTVTEERVRAISEIWTQEEAKFHGRNVDFDAIWSWPKPIQQPRPPILIGGNAPRTLRRVIDFGDGWIAIDSPRLDIRSRLAELAGLALDAERATPPVTICAWQLDGHRIKELHDLGVARCLAAVPVSSYDALHGFLNHYSG